jgi:mannan endo-1,4-beta-mannosidase
MERYPGNDYVDLLGFDTYQKTVGNADYIASIRNSLTILQKLAKERNKLYAITETGLTNLTNSQWWTAILYPAIQGFDLSHVLIWRNKNLPDDIYAPYVGEASSDDFITFKNKSDILFLNDIQ